MYDQLRYLLLQVRNSHDPMRSQEVDCFAHALHCHASQISVYDLLGGVPSRAEIDAVDMVLLGGSGDYSVAAGGDWLPAALDAMRELYDWNKPTFASCWGFQAMAKALGGDVVTDMNRAELGTLDIRLADQGQADPVFGPLPRVFRATWATKISSIVFRSMPFCWRPRIELRTRRFELTANQSTARNSIPSCGVIRTWSV